MNPARDPSSRFRVDGQVAIVTGASSGLGVAVARSLRSAGARVALVARRADRLHALADELDGEAIACDLLDPVARAQVVPSVVTKLGPPTLLVNAAGGVTGITPAEDESLEAIARTLELNLVAAMHLAQAVFPHQRSQGGGSTVFISSIGGRVGVPGIPQASYAASKAGLSGLCTELAIQWAPHKIRVNTVAPGFFRSEITDSLYDTERGRAWLERNPPLGSDATAEDIVGAIQWLCSPAGSYATGQTIVVDGGWTAR